MSDHDDVKPFHAKDATSGQEAADAVAAVLKHAHERDAAAKQKVGPKQQPKWLLPVGVNLGIFAAYLLIWSPDWVVINPIAPPPVEQQVRQTAGGLFMAGSKIESFERDNGRLPTTLAEAGLNANTGLDYTVRGDTYVLYIEVEGQAVSYNSAVQPLADWGEENVPDMFQRIGG